MDLARKYGLSNSTTDMTFLFSLNNGEESYIARISDEGFGATDIYKIEFKKETLESFAEKAVKQKCLKL